MFQNKRKAALLPLLAFIAVCAVVLAIVSSQPYDRPSRNLANSFGNVKNGGMVAEDSNLLYYVDESGVLRCQGEGDTYRIAENATCVNPYHNGVIYLSDGKICYSSFAGGEQTVYAENVDYMELSGYWLFYTRDGRLFKQRVGSDKETDLGVQVGQYAVTGTFTYYIGEDGYFYYMRNDGSQRTKFFDTKMTQFQFFRDYIMYVDESGALCQTYTANAAYNDRLADKCEQFIITEDGILLLYDGETLYYRELTVDGSKLEPVQADFDSVSNLQYIDDTFYLYADGALISMQKDGSEQQVW